MDSVSADCLPGSHATLSAFIVLSCVFWQINTYIHTMPSEKEFLMEFALNQRPIRPLSTTRRVTQ